MSEGPRGRARQRRGARTARAVMVTDTPEGPDPLAGGSLWDRLRVAGHSQNLIGIGYGILAMMRWVMKWDLLPQCPTLWYGMGKRLGMWAKVGGKGVVLGVKVVGFGNGTGNCPTGKSLQILMYWHMFVMVSQKFSTNWGFRWGEVGESGGFSLSLKCCF